MLRNEKERKQRLRLVSVSLAGRKTMLEQNRVQVIRPKIAQENIGSIYIERHYSGRRKNTATRLLTAALFRGPKGCTPEFLLDKVGEPKLYLYDKAMKPLEKTNLEAKLTLKGHGGAQHSRDLKDQWHHVRFSHH